MGATYFWEVANGGYFFGTTYFLKPAKIHFCAFRAKIRLKKRVGPLFLAGRGALIFGREGKPKSPHPAINNEQPAPNGILCPCINGKHFGNAKGRFIIYGMGAAYYGNPYNSRESPYLRLIFTQHTIWPLRNPKISTVQFRSPPPDDASNFVRPPLTTHP